MFNRLYAAPPATPKEEDMKRPLLLTIPLLLILCNVSSGSERPSTAICDSRSINGICTEYNLNQISSDQVEDSEHECVNLYLKVDNKVFKGGVFSKGKHCPTDNRVGICKNFKMPNLDEFSYDKHYYAGVNEYYPWHRGSIESTCKLGAGTYYDNKNATEQNGKKVKALKKK